MKKTNMLFFIFLLFLICACDEEKVNQENQDNCLQMYGMNYPLTHGVLWHELPSSVVEFNTFIFYDIYVNSYSEKITTDTIEVPSADVSDKVSGKFIISLYGDQVVFNESEKKAYGKSNAVVFHMSVANDEFETGTYSFARTNEPRTFYGYSSINYSFTDKAGAVNPIGSGELTVNKDGDIYEVVFDCKSTSNQVLKGTYRGTLQLVDNREISLIEVKDVVLSGMRDTTYSFDSWENPPTFYSAAYDYQSEIYAISNTGMLLSQAGCNSVSDPKLVDLAYMNYYPTKDRCAFLSPVKVRPYQHHRYYHKNHTKFINDVASSNIRFTVDDFDKLTFSDGATFRSLPIESDDKDFSVDVSLPRIVLFQNSYGVKGAIKIKEIVPVQMIDKAYENEVSGGFVYHREPGGGYVRFDVKMQKTSAIDNIK